MALLTDAQLAAALRHLPEWSRDGDAIRREVVLRDFSAAMAFVNRVAALAEAADHHPDIEIRWNQVTLTLSTHSEGGVTSRDVALAGQIDEAVLS
ncbi:MAG TPA: 4a-hydroxytetrahydrobiopterin dehydratase [Candidatus Limnocylindria bacterium]|nr:4a-hydroxytetrahydrobiopterin dehydratase [Candidatus Limnocylindria bacterium]